MTFKQVSKHSKVIKWFCDNPDKGVWRKDFHTGAWHFCRQPEFNYKDTYVQNDECVEFRKALADGNKVRMPEDNGKTWFTHCDKLDSWYNIENIRIKPEEPEFKVGDWVREKSSGFIIQAYENMISKNFELWKPKKDEWCVFWDYEEKLKSGVLMVDLFKSKSTMGYISKNVIRPFKNIAPLEFIQTLKDKK